MPPRLHSTLVISSGQTASPALDLRARPNQGAKGLLIVAPTTLTETVTVHVAANVAGTFQAYQPEGADLTIPAAKAIPLKDIARIGVGAIKLVASTAVGADRTFEVSVGDED